MLTIIQTDMEAIGSNIKTFVWNQVNAAAAAVTLSHHQYALSDDITSS